MVFLVSFDVVVRKGLAGEADVTVGVQIIGHEHEALAGVEESARPVEPALLRVRLVWVVEVEVGALGHNNLQQSHVQSAH